MEREVQRDWRVLVKRCSQCLGSPCPLGVHFFIRPRAFSPVASVFLDQCLIAFSHVCFLASRQTCAQDMLAEYSSACRDTLALPTVMGIKSPKER